MVSPGLKNEDTVVIPKYLDQTLPGASVFEDAAEAVKAAGLKIIRMYNRFVLKPLQRYWLW